MTEDYQTDCNGKFCLIIHVVQAVITLDMRGRPNSNLDCTDVLIYDNLTWEELSDIIREKLTINELFNRENAINENGNGKRESLDLYIIQNNIRVDKLDPCFRLIEEITEQVNEEAKKQIAEQQTIAERKKRIQSEKNRLAEIEKLKKKLIELEKGEAQP